MRQAKLEQFLKTIDSRYRAILIASKRSRQLQQGLRPLFEGKTVKVTTMALEEIISGKVQFDITTEDNEPIDYSLKPDNRPADDVPEGTREKAATE